MFKSFLLTVLLIKHCDAQCSSTCPPIDDSGNPVESLCVGDTFTSSVSSSYDTCYPANAPAEIDFNSLKSSYDVIVVSNYYVGCNAGRRESGVYAYTSQRMHDANNRIGFVSAVHGGGSCTSWSDIYSDFAEDTFNFSPATSWTMPLTVEDSDYRIRDELFTSPFPHPSYVVLDSTLTVRDKFVGPCCGYVFYTDCSVATASTLDGILEASIQNVLDNPPITTNTPSSSPTAAPTAAPSSSPTMTPTSGPTMTPTSGPTMSPSFVPSVSPSFQPSDAPSSLPTSTPSTRPSSPPSGNPTSRPSFTPSSQPTTIDCGDGIMNGLETDVDCGGSECPKCFAGATCEVNSDCLSHHCDLDSLVCIDAPSTSPTSSPSTTHPTATPTSTPSAFPSSIPTNMPSASPSTSPTHSPSSNPPSASPSVGPTNQPSGNPTATPTVAPLQPNTWSPFSPCSNSCGAGERFRFMTKIEDEGDEGEVLVETESCINNVCDGCELRATFEILAENLSHPWDVAFHPRPGSHLKTLSEARSFSTEGLEAWVANAGNHTLTIVSGIDTEHMTTISRRDRGYFHYMTHIAAISFNEVGVEVSGRTEDKDTFGYFATCQNNNNDYLGSKEPNYFMGPSLYDSRSNDGRRNLVNLMGDECDPENSEECFFLHSDMLHEAPSCVGIVHDPEVSTSYGNVYWQIDGWNQQLVRFDFQQPHGPGSMEHSIAAVRRFPEIDLEVSLDHHAGMAINENTGLMYVANYHRNSIAVIDTASGKYARTAREEYPIFSSRLPSFEYSIYECTLNRKISVIEPTGIAVDKEKNLLYVASGGSRIVVLDISTDAIIEEIETGYENIMGIALGADGKIYFVDAVAEVLVAVSVADETDCLESFNVRNAEYDDFVAIAPVVVTGGHIFSQPGCLINPNLPNASLFDQVHLDSGYAHNGTMDEMNAAAALLANRTDCGFDSELNFDALLLGGFFCHVCLEETFCQGDEVCENVQWRGAVCVEQKDEGGMEVDSGGDGDGDDDDDGEGKEINTEEALEAGASSLKSHLSLLTVLLIVALTLS